MDEDAANATDFIGGGTEAFAAGPDTNQGEPKQANDGNFTEVAKKNVV